MQSLERWWMNAIDAATWFMEYLNSEFKRSSPEAFDNRLSAEFAIVVHNRSMNNCLLDLLHNTENPIKRALVCLDWREHVEYIKSLRKALA